MQQKLKCECGDFKVDALPNREPMQGIREDCSSMKNLFRF